MIGIIVILGISWLLLHFLMGENLLTLGILPTGKGVKLFVIGFVLMAIINVGFIYAESLIKSMQWEMNPQLSIHSIFLSLWYHLKSALTEELIFRGALLYILISKIGTQKALILSAIVFGVYHWFSYGMLGSGIIPLTFILVITGLMGYAWAYSFAKAKTLLLPLGLHLGWNFISTLYSEATPYGELVFVKISSVELSEISNFIFSLAKGLIPPLIVIAFVKWWLNDDKSQLEEIEPEVNVV